MKAQLLALYIMCAYSGGVQNVAAQGARYFRISGPTNTTILAFRRDGTLVWSNRQAVAIYTIQAAQSLSGGSNWVNFVQIPTTSAVNTNQLVDFNPPVGMELIPAGSFTMGDTLDGEVNAAPAYVSVSAFYMDVNPVSYSQWQMVYNWATIHGYGFVSAGAGKAANHPVQSLDWYDAVKWSNARSQQAGLTPVYYTDAELKQVYTNGELVPYVNWAVKGFRLPTEAEWEKAARGGLEGQRFPWGKTISESQANYYGDTNDFSFDLGPNGPNAAYTNGASPYTSPVGSFAANGYGLYDMAGNVFEWCWDWFGTPYAGGSDPRGPSSGTFKVLRGGAWDLDADYARCAYRFLDLPSDGNEIYVGFRCVRGF